MKYIRVKRRDFQMHHGGKEVDLYYLRSRDGIEMAVTNFGARVVELWVPDRNGDFEDIVLGNDSIDRYINFKGERYLGAVIGRYGNRIAGARFNLNGKEYQLPINNGPNCLHGGIKSFDMVVWDVRQIDERSLLFHYLSRDGEEGFPGNLEVEMLYSLTDKNEFQIRYSAVTDKSTVVNLTHHSYFNLHGEGIGTINDHLLRINADSFIPVDESLIPDGRVLSVEGTPMDFRAPITIGEQTDMSYQQLIYGNGFDHTWVIDRQQGVEPAYAATLIEPISGRRMDIYTTEPGIHFYAGNFFDGVTPGKRGIPYAPHAGLAFEAQHFPNSPNNPDFPTTVLNPGESYNQICSYRFGVER